ncbi:MAG: hypothetical protein PWQ93_199 [Clostridiales bacterium]|nr:hypothetical protein [Clostridiales bacterium]
MVIRVRDIIDFLTAEGIKRERTVDRIEFGNPDMIVEGIATAFLATQQIVEKAMKLGVNLIISHEGIFFSHWDKTEMLKADPVYKEKRKIIEENKIAIFRYHDYIHDHIPDGIMVGLLKELGWEKLEVRREQTASVIEIPTATLEEIILYIKKQLNVEHIRYIGNLAMPCRRIGLLVGYRGQGDLAIDLIQREKPELLIYGEGPEWETPEYIRDSIQQGRQRALIVLGHAESEAPGMKYLAGCLQNKFPDIPVYFIAETPIFKIL